MPEVTISEETYAKMAAFKGVVEEILEEEMSLEDCADLILRLGVDRMLADIMGETDLATLVASFQQLGSRHPEQVYSYVVEMLSSGADIQERERLRRQIGIEKRRSEL